MLSLNTHHIHLWRLSNTKMPGRIPGLLNQGLWLWNQETFWILLRRFWWIAKFWLANMEDGKSAGFLLYENKSQRTNLFFPWGFTMVKWKEYSLESIPGLNPANEKVLESFIASSQLPNGDWYFLVRAIMSIKEMMRLYYRGLPLVSGLSVILTFPFSLGEQWFFKMSASAPQDYPEF